jgi:hypothetical protein
MTTLSERNALVRLLDTLDASNVTLKRDGDKGDLAIFGKYGHVYADGNG